MNKILLLVLLIVFSNTSYSKYYAGFGGNYNLIQKPNDLINNDFASYNLHLENRSKCKLWYGLALNYSSLSNNIDALPDSPFFNYIAQFEPSIRYNFIANNTVTYSFVPYVKTSLLIGYVDAKDQLSDKSLGGTLSAGLSYGFIAFDECFMIDLNFGYTGFNTLYRSDNRMFLESLNFGLNLSMKI